jgi:hypothetical protein
LPELTWRPSSDINGDVVNYRLEVKDGTEVIVNETVSDNRYTFKNNLTYGKHYSITLKAVDDKGASSGELMSELEILNTPPVMSIIPDQALTQDTTWDLQITATDSDIPADTLRFLVNPAMFAIDASTGYVNWTPTKYTVGEFLLNFSVTDGNGGIDFQIVKLKIANVNDQPEINITSVSIEFDEDTLLINAFNLNELFFDIDFDELTFTFQNRENILINALKNGSVDLSSAKNWYGRESIDVTATDPSGANVSLTFDIKVNPVNDAPVLQSIPDIFTNESRYIRIDPVATDIDNDDYSLIYNSSWIELLWGTYTNYRSAGIYNVNISVTDGELVDWQIVKITIENVNRIIDTSPRGNHTFYYEQSGKYGEHVKFFPNIVDPDDDTNDNGMIDGNDIDNLTYYWDFGDGTYSNEKFPDHTYKKSSDRYKVILTIKDPENETYSVERIVFLEQKDRNSSSLSGSVIISAALLLAIIAIILFLIIRSRSKRSKSSFVSSRPTEKKGQSDDSESDEDQIAE